MSKRPMKSVVSRRFQGKVASSWGNIGKNVGTRSRPESGWVRLSSDCRDKVSTWILLGFRVSFSDGPCLHLYIRGKRGWRSLGFVDLVIAAEKVCCFKFLPDGCTMKSGGGGRRARRLVAISFIYNRDPQESTSHLHAFPGTSPIRT